jgi:flagellum-specific peptidoglycan hydrolase FlgJ
MMTRNEFVAKYWPDVVKATKGTGILPEVALAQMILESGSGNSKLATEANNFFGIKVPGKVPWTGEIYYAKTNEEDKNGKVTVITAPFRKYNSALDSIKDYVAWLKSNPRYTKHGVFEAKTVEAQAAALKAAGYATSVKYASVVTDVYNSIKHNLWDVAESVTETATTVGKSIVQNKNKIIAGIAIIGFSLILGLSLLSVNSKKI